MVLGQNYAPEGKPQPVVKEGEFVFAAAALDHGHIYGQTNGLLEAGGTIKYVYDKDRAKAARFAERYPKAVVADDLEIILQDKEIQLVAAAAVTNERSALGRLCMEHGKHYFTDKAPFTTLEQVELTKETVKKTGRKYACYYSERLHNECSVFASQLVESGVIGKVINVIGLGPHRLNAKSRPAWFFEREKYGGILCDIGSHQIEQFLHYTGAADAKVVNARVANYNHPQYPELNDYGDASLTADNGAVHYFRVDWFTPDGLGTWGDGRLFIMGTKGTIELRKYINVGVSKISDCVYLVTEDTEEYINVAGKVGFPYFGQLILDCLNGTENAMTQAHCFKAAELCVTAQMAAEGNL
jgi:predicted dehydrogenase